MYKNLINEQVYIQVISWERNLATLAKVTMVNGSPMTTKIRQKIRPWNNLKLESTNQSVWYQFHESQNLRMDTPMVQQHASCQQFVLPKTIEPMQRYTIKISTNPTCGDRIFILLKNVEQKNRRLVFLILVSQYSNNLAEALQFLCQMFYLSTARNRIKKSFTRLRAMKEYQSLQSTLGEDDSSSNRRCILQEKKKVELK
uniref:Uncharacterized protein n=1 Tax=Romanomermis culicivorax TaxID=13658 RepID=A0A915IW20_ROMCU